MYVDKHSREKPLIIVQISTLRVNNFECQETSSCLMRNSYAARQVVHLNANRLTNFAKIHIFYILIIAPEKNIIILRFSSAYLHIIFIYEFITSILSKN